MALNVYDHADAGTKLVIDRLKARVEELEADLAAKREQNCILNTQLTNQIHPDIQAERERCIRLVALAEGEWAARKLLEPA